MRELADKVIMITGAAQGIGREIAQRFSEEGSKLIILDVNEEKLSQAETQLKKKASDVLALKADVKNPKQLKDIVNKSIDKFSKIDILINNAGVTRDNLLLRLSEEEWDLVLEVNLKGAFNCIKEVSRFMVRQRHGKIINIASIIGLIGNPGQTNYAASKGGLIALTKSVAKELASRNIQVNAVAPGFIDTQMTQVLPDEVKQKMLENIPLGRFGSPKDVAECCIFLSSSASDYITGQVLVVDGGMVM